MLIKHVIMATVMFTQKHLCVVSAVYKYFWETGLDNCTAHLGLSGSSHPVYSLNVYHIFYPAARWLSVCLCVSGAEEVVSCFTYQPTNRPGRATLRKDALSLSSCFLDENR